MEDSASDKDLQAVRMVVEREGHVRKSWGEGRHYETTFDLGGHCAGACGV